MIWISTSCLNSLFSVSLIILVISDAIIFLTAVARRCISKSDINVCDGNTWEGSEAIETGVEKFVGIMPAPYPTWEVCMWGLVGGMWWICDGDDENDCWCDIMELVSESDMYSRYFFSVWEDNGEGSDDLLLLSLSIIRQHYMNNGVSTGQCFGQCAS